MTVYTSERPQQIKSEAPHKNNCNLTKRGFSSMLQSNDEASTSINTRSSNLSSAQNKRVHTHNMQLEHYCINESIPAALTVV